MRTLLASLLLLIGTPLVTSAANPMDGNLFGVYKESFSNGDITGRTYRSENILELVNLPDRAAYFRIHLEFYNGHICSLYGVAERNAAMFTYQSSDSDPSGHHCILDIKPTDKAIVLREGTPAFVCKEMNCGERGGFDGVSFERGKRRDIRYMPRLLKSREYADAIAEYAARHKK